MRRIAVACLIGVLSAVACYRYQVVFDRGAGDLTWPLCGARALLAGSDPYLCRVIMASGALGPTNPLTTILAVLPLVWLRPEVAAGVFFGFSSALLAAGLTRDGQWWRLMVFLAFPYWQALQVVQWAPLLMAAALTPAGLPLTLVKPHIGAAIALTRLTWSRTIACVVFVLVSLLIDPSWPLRWLPQTRTYDGMAPLLVLPFGPLLLLAVLRWRNEGARTLLLLSIVPQRLYYDQLLLWLIPRTAREVMLLNILSWASYFACVLVFGNDQRVVLLLEFLPVLMMVLWPVVADATSKGRTPTPSLASSPSVPIADSAIVQP